MLFAVAYTVVDNVTAILSCSPSVRASVLAVLPKLVQACFAVLGDFYTWKLAEKVYGQGSRSAWSAVRLKIPSSSTRVFLADHVISYA